MPQSTRPPLFGVPVVGQIRFARPAPSAPRAQWPRLIRNILINFIHGRSWRTSI
jgi:hypothetical protein